MQKKLIAAAIAGLVAVPALAQTNVTISGRVAAGWESYKQKDCPVAICSTDNETRISDQSSRIIFNVTEDLGGGLSAWAQLDSRFGVDSSVSGGWNGGNTGLGLMHKQWGKFTLGHWDVHYQELTPLEASRAGSLQTLLGNGMLSQVSTPVGAATLANGTRTSNLIMWDSPNWNGFTARLGYSTGFAANSNEGSGLNPAGTGNAGGGWAWTGTVRYNNGPWAGGLSYWRGKAENRIPAAPIDQSSWRGWVGYTFDMGLKIGFAYDRSTLENASVFPAPDLGGDHKRSAWMLPVSYRWGPHAVYGNYARASDASNSSGFDTGGSAWSLGYDYAFSKRTSAGIFYTQYNNKDFASYNMFALGANGATPNVVGIDSRQWYIGMAHNF